MPCRVRDRREECVIALLLSLLKIWIKQSGNSPIAFQRDIIITQKIKAENNISIHSMFSNIIIGCCKLELYRIKTRKILRHKQRNGQLHDVKFPSLYHFICINKNLWNRFCMILILCRTYHFAIPEAHLTYIAGRVIIQKHH